MDLDGADGGTLPTVTAARGPELEQELSLSGTRCQTESGGGVSLQLLEFKTHLLEVVEELHIRRDAETRFEDQISKLVLEKQELEWEKESLQHQAKTLANQHTESLNNVKKQFQAKIRNIEEEKGKYQVSAELKDNEINNLKEELKSLQLLKYNLEKKSGELEQKLALQSRSKDDRLNLLAEVERRFAALSRQCAAVKQAHGRLQHDVDEAMERNKKLTSANEKLEATVVSLKKELEEVNNKLMEAKMSAVRRDGTLSPTAGEQRLQQLQHKLSMETEMNKRLEEENVAARAEKQEVLRALQQNQQLLLAQTQTVSRVELQLQTQRQQQQDLKQEHEVMREKTEAAEEKAVRLTESFAASEADWAAEKAAFLDRIESEQRERRAADEAFGELQWKHAELSSQAEELAQRLSEIERSVSSRSLSVWTQFPARPDEDTPDDPVLRSESRSASAQTRKPDGLEDAGAAAAAAAGGQDTLNQHPRPLNASNLFTCPPTNNNNSFCSLTGATNEHITNSNTSETDVASDLIQTPSTVCDDGLLIVKRSDVSTAASSNVAVSCPVELLSKENSDEGNGGINDKEEGWRDDLKHGENNCEEKGRDEEQQWTGEDVREEDVKEKGGGGRARGRLVTQTADIADRRGDSRGSTGDAGDSEQPETETRDRAGGEGTHAAQGGAETAPRSPENQITAQTSADTTTQRSGARPVVDLVDAGGSGGPCEEAADSNRGREPSRVVRDDRGSNSEHLHRREDETRPPESHKQVSERPSDKPGSSSHTNNAAAAAAAATQSDDTGNVREVERTSGETEACNHPEITCSRQERDEMFETHVGEELVGTMSETQAQSEELQDGEDADAKTRGSQSNICEINQQPAGNACAGVTVEFESEVETGGRPEVTPHDEAGDAEDAKATGSDDVRTGRDASADLPRSAEKKELDRQTSRSAFVWSSRAATDVCGLQRFVQGFQTSEPNPSGLLGHPSVTIPTFPKNNHGKVPLVIRRASDLLSASSVSGISSSRPRQSERRPPAADMESRASTSGASFTANATSVTAGALSWPTTPGCIRVPASAGGQRSESDWDLSSSPEREDQQSLRAQISRIEQFLNSERLRLPKRRRTEPQT